MTSQQIKNTARLRLATAGYPPKKLVLIYMAITAGANLLSLLLSFAVSLMMENTGGLSDLGTRAILETVSTVFSYAVQIAAPLFSMGLLHCFLLVTREKTATPKDLLTGPKRWGVTLRLGFLLALTYFAIGYLLLNVASIVFAFLPTSKGVMESMMAMMEKAALAETVPSMEDLLPLAKALAPAYVIWAILLVVVLIPLSYRLRLTTFQIMEETPTGAIKAAFQSLRLMKGNCKSLFKLDLSFWWYYLLQILLSAAISVAAYFVSDVWYVVAYCVYCLAFFLLEYRFLSLVQVSYAVFYDSLQEAPTTPLPQIEE